MPISSDQPISGDQLDVVLRFHDDRRALIAAGKLQRWDVVKWSVTANFALGAASAAVPRGLHGLFFLFVVAIAAMAWVLLWHYNYRMTQVRNSLKDINVFLTKNIIDISKIGGVDFIRDKDLEYDRQEMRIFYSASMLSIFPTLLSWEAIW